ncbi:methylisocitrate lyase [Salibacterium halotolerans]|uniref:Methylisocitrate lyase n=1 Tax=Salibacterium halotolerans TaxID=1884432 RepID=A0A1I5RMQ9_9BACI|nr:methylisocitrate lyase [Salibacterium halotolerans]SFP59783.1 methylisocitrate lyase [Salibacterium halotolerans]
MTWLTQNQKSQKQLAEEFRIFMEEKSILKLMGVHDGMAGVAAKEAGFQSLYLSGAAFTASKGLPDIGILQSTEVAERAKEITRAADLPLLVDVDTGFGGPLNVARTVKEMVEANVAAIQIEDQRLPKKCGHLNGKQLISAEDMVQKIQMAKEIEPSLIVVARTDAHSVEGMDEALKRAQIYEKAGADAIFPEAVSKEEEFEAFTRCISKPLLANMTEFGKTPYYTAEEFESMGYQMVIYPVTSLRVAAKAYKEAFREIYQKGTQKDILENMQTREELYESIHLNDYENLDDKISTSILPEQGERR